MMTPFLLLLASLVGLFAAYSMPGWSDLVMIAGPTALASLFLFLRALLKRPGTQAEQVILDGSNVMYWRDETPNITTLREVLAHVSALGMMPGVVFDANAGHLLFGAYKHDRAFARQLGLPEDRVMVVPKGTPADPVILTAARDLGARIVTNDRYRDWADDYPEIGTPGHLIRGGYHDSGLWLDLRHPDHP